MLTPCERQREPERLMLVLSRQRDESIIIGDNVVITVVDVRGDKVADVDATAGSGLYESQHGSE